MKRLKGMVPFTDGKKGGKQMDKDLKYLKGIEKGIAAVAVAIVVAIIATLPLA